MLHWFISLICRSRCHRPSSQESKAHMVVKPRMRSVFFSPLAHCSLELLSLWLFSWLNLNLNCLLVLYSIFRVMKLSLSNLCSSCPVGLCMSTLETCTVNRVWRLIKWCNPPSRSAASGTDKQLSVLMWPINAQAADPGTAADLCSLLFLFLCKIGDLKCQCLTTDLNCLI